MHVQQQRRGHEIDIIMGQDKIAGVIIPGPDREGDGQIMGTGQGDRVRPKWASWQTGQLPQYDVYSSEHGQV